MNEKHIPLCILVQDKKKPLVFGTYTLKDYIENKLKNDATLNDAIKLDQEELNLAQDYPYYAGEPNSAYSSLVAGQGPSMLNFPLEFMTHEELYKWLVREIWQDATSRGVKTKGGQIKFKDERFRPSFWPDELWPWAETKHLFKVNSSYLKILQYQ